MSALYRKDQNPSSVIEKRLKLIEIDLIISKTPNILTFLINFDIFDLLIDNFDLLIDHLQSNFLLKD